MKNFVLIEIVLAVFIACTGNNHKSILPKNDKMSVLISFIEDRDTIIDSRPKCIDSILLTQDVCTPTTVVYILNAKCSFCIQSYFLFLEKWNAIQSSIPLYVITNDLCVTEYYVAKFEIKMYNIQYFDTNIDEAETYNGMIYLIKDSLVVNEMINPYY